MRLWDRFFDSYLHQPMQRIVLDRIRPDEARDPTGVAEARATIAIAYGMVEDRMRGRDWAAGETLSLADCAALPALFYASTVAPFPVEALALADYLRRLLDRPSVARVIEEARPFFGHYPFKENLPSHLQTG